MYKNIQSTVINNGYMSQYFTLQRGLRQECPLSALLFLIIAEFLANRIRTSTEISGVKLTNTTDLRISMYADDTTLFLSDQISIRNAIDIITNFGTIAGPKLNL